MCLQLCHVDSITDLSVSLCVYSFVMLIPSQICQSLYVFTALSCCWFHCGSQSVYVSQICHVVDSIMDLSLFMCQICHVVDSTVDLSLFMCLQLCHVVDSIVDLSLFMCLQLCHVDSIMDLSLFMCLQLCHVVDSIMDLSLFMYACVYFLWWCHVVDHIPLSWLCTGTLVLQSCRVTSLGRNCPLSLASANGLCNHQQ